MRVMMKNYMRPITYSPALKSPIVPRTHFYCWLKFFMDANCSDQFSIMPLKLDSKFSVMPLKLEMKVFYYATKNGIETFVDGNKKDRPLGSVQRMMFNNSTSKPWVHAMKLQRYHIFYHVYYAHNRSEKRQTYRAQPF